MSERMKLAALLEAFAPGSQHDRWTWHQEACWLWVNHHADMAWLVADILRHGQRTPVLLGSDGRVWDGHHRIVAHLAIHAEDIEVMGPGEPALAAHRAARTPQEKP